jgi:hypothetical protein
MKISTVIPINFHVIQNKTSSEKIAYYSAYTFLNQNSIPEPYSKKIFRSKSIMTIKLFGVKLNWLPKI